MSLSLTPKSSVIKIYFMADQLLILEKYMAKERYKKWGPFAKRDNYQRPLNKYDQMIEIEPFIIFSATLIL